MLGNEVYLNRIFCFLLSLFFCCITFLCFSIGSVFASSNVYNEDKDFYYDTIQEAVDDADEYNTLQLSEHIFYENVNVNKSLTVVGRGVEETIVRAVENEGSIFRVSGTTSEYISFTLKDVTLDHQNLTSTIRTGFSNGLWARYVDGLHVENVHAINFGDDHRYERGGFSIVDTDNVFLKDLLVDNVYGRFARGFRFGRVTEVYAENITVTNVYGGGANDWMFYLYMVEDGVFKNLHAENFYSIGVNTPLIISLSMSHNLSFEDVTIKNIVDGQTVAAIKLDYSDNNTFRNVLIDGLYSTYLTSAINLSHDAEDFGCMCNNLFEDIIIRNIEAPIQTRAISMDRGASNNTFRRVDISDIRGQLSGLTSLSIIAVMLSSRDDNGDTTGNVVEDLTIRDINTTGSFYGIHLNTVGVDSDTFANSFSDIDIKFTDQDSAQMTIGLSEYSTCSNTLKDSTFEGLVYGMYVNTPNCTFSISDNVFLSNRMHIRGLGDLLHRYAQNYYDLAAFVESDSILYGHLPTMVNTLRFNLGDATSPVLLDDTNIFVEKSNSVFMPENLSITNGLGTPVVVNDLETYIDRSGIEMFGLSPIHIFKFGSSSETLSFDQPISVSIPVAQPNGTYLTVYRSDDKVDWDKDGFVTDWCLVDDGKCSFDTHLSGYFGLLVPPVYNVDQDKYYVKIQEGVDDANPGETLEVSAGVYREQVTINIPLTIIGADRDTTIIDGSDVIAQRDGLIHISGVSSGSVNISGFTIRNAPMFEKRIGVYVTGNQGDLVFSHNKLYGIVSNPLLFEVHTGGVEVAHNSFMVSGASAIFSMSYATGQGNNDVDALQNFHNNYIDANGGSGMVFASAFGASGYGERTGGKYTNVYISDNHIVNVGNHEKGIQLEVDGDEGGFVNPVISGNTIESQNPGNGTSRGIRLLGDITNAEIYENSVTGFYRAIFQSGTWGQPIYATGTEIYLNHISQSTFGVDIVGGEATVFHNSILNSMLNWDGAELLNATCNWWGTTDKDVMEGFVLGYVDFIPFLIFDDLYNPVCATAPNFTLIYTSTVGGWIDGESEQVVDYGEDGEMVTAVGDEGYVFDGWSDGIDTLSRTELNVSEDLTVEAMFSRKQYTINVTSSAGGKATGGGIYDHGANVHLNATANVGYDFVHWSAGGVVVSTDSDFSFVALSDANLKAIFELKTYTINISVMGNGRAVGAGTYNYGDSVLLLAIPGPRSTFRSWQEDGQVISRINAFRITVTRDMDFVAFFGLVPDPVSPRSDVYAITATVEPEDYGSITPSGNIIVNEGQSRTFSITTNDGYRILSVFVDGVNQGRISTYTFGNINANHTIHATFEEIEEEEVLIEDGVEAIIIEQEEIDLDEDEAETVGIFGRFVRNLRGVDDSVIQNSTATVSAAAIPLTAISLLSTQFAAFYYFLQAVFAVLGFLGIRQKGRVYAVVYDSVAKEPIQNALVKVYDEDGRVVQTNLSDANGLVSGSFPNGEYVLEVFARGFNHPSKVVKTKTDGDFKNIYNSGERVRIGDFKSFKYSIPVDPLEVDKLKYARAIFINRMSIFLTFLQRVLVLFGFVLAIFAYLTNATFFNIALILIYIPVLFLTFIHIFNWNKGYNR